MLKFNQNIGHLSPQDTVLLRVDFNLPRDKDGQLVLNDRVFAMLPVIKQIVAKGCAVIVVSHMGRPRPGVFEEQYSLASLAPVLSEKLGLPVSFLSSWPQQKTYLAPATVALAENTRFLVGELDNDLSLAQKMLEGVSVVVMEAFACSHRKHASTVGITSLASRIILGPEHSSEIDAIEKFMRYRERCLAVVGGKKIATKLSLLEQLIAKMDVLCLGGGIGNTILHSQGYNLGTSFIEYSQLRSAAALCELATANQVDLVLPEDVVVCENLQDAASVRTVRIEDIAPHEKVVDIGPSTVARFKSKLIHAQSVYWNGPLGVYEYEHGLAGCAAWASAMSQVQAYSLVGGGDTLSVLHALGIKRFSHVSTGGGAFLHYLAHGTSPVLSLLQTEEERQQCVEQRS